MFYKALTMRKEKQKIRRGPRPFRAPWRRGAALLVIAGLLGRDAAAAPGDPPAPPVARSPLSISQAVALALTRHPGLAARAAVEATRAAQTEQARMALLPRLEVAAQLTRSTGNLVQGSVFAQPGVPAVTGPPMAVRFDEGVFGSAVSLAAAWDVAGLAQRMAQVDAGLAAQAQAQAGSAARRLEIAYGAADSYLQLWAAQAVAQAAQANEERTRTLSMIIESLQRAELRPGADLSRARAELALAQTQKVRAEQGVAVARIQLAEALGTAGANVDILPLPTAAPGGPGADPTPAAAQTLPDAHPLLQEAQQAATAAATQLRATRLQYLPRVELVAALWSRGSGLGPSVTAGGLLPDAPNWGVGLIASWSALESFAVRARVHAATAQKTLAEAQQQETAQAVKAQAAAAQATLDAAVRVLGHAPSALAAARATEQQALARYKAGLARVLDVADAQRLLAQTESEDALARIAVLRARLLLCRALGDLGPFLDAMDAPRGGG